MSAVMIYYLYANAPAGLGFDKADAAQLISLYATVVGMTTIIGSYVCDRILGCRKLWDVWYSVHSSQEDVSKL